MANHSRLALSALALWLPLAPARAADTPASPGRQQAEAWSVALELPAPTRAGTPALATVRLAARAGYHVNLEYPAAFKPDPQATATFGGARVALATVSRRPCPGGAGETCQVELALPFTPGPPPVRVSGTVLFSVCTAERCLIERVALAAVR